MRANSFIAIETVVRGCADLPNQVHSIRVHHPGTASRLPPVLLGIPTFPVLVAYALTHAEHTLGDAQHLRISTKANFNDV